MLKLLCPVTKVGDPHLLGSTYISRNRAFFCCSVSGSGVLGLESRPGNQLPSDSLESPYIQNVDTGFGMGNVGAGPKDTVSFSDTGFEQIASTLAS